MKRHFLFLFLFFLILLPACRGRRGNVQRGILYTHITIPYTTDLDNTPRGNKTAEGKIIHIKEPFSGYGVYTEFSSNAIGELAKYAGIETIYFADLEIFNLFGIYRYQNIHIYGSADRDDDDDK